MKIYYYHYNIYLLIEDQSPKKNAVNGRILDGPANESNAMQWHKDRTLDGEDSLLQLSLSETEHHLLGTTALGFCVWNVADLDNRKEKAGQRVDLRLPTGVRNISVRLLQSNSIILSKHDEFAVAGVRCVRDLLLF